MSITNTCDSTVHQPPTHTPTATRDTGRPPIEVTIVPEGSGHDRHQVRAKVYGQIHRKKDGKACNKGKANSKLVLNEHGHELKQDHFAWSQTNRQLRSLGPNASIDALAAAGNGVKMYVKFETYVEDPTSGTTKMHIELQEVVGQAGAPSFPTCDVSSISGVSTPDTSSSSLPAPSPLAQGGGGGGGVAFALPLTPVNTGQVRNMPGTDIKVKVARERLHAADEDRQLLAEHAAQVQRRAAIDKIARLEREHAELEDELVESKKEAADRGTAALAEQAIHYEGKLQSALADVQSALADVHLLETFLALPAKPTLDDLRAMRT